ncbi:MAG: hypothetical protein ACJAZ4_001136 [Neptuniibacter pectenicola]
MLLRKQLKTQGRGKMRILFQAGEKQTEDEEGSVYILSDN